MLLRGTPREVLGGVYSLDFSTFNPQADSVLEPGKVYDGSTADRVDDFLRKVPENSTIHLGRNTFETRGVWDIWLGDLTKGFRLKSGWTILGAGTNSAGGTVLRLIDVPVDKSGLYNNNSVLSTGGAGLYSENRPVHLRPNVNHVAIRDLQVDCNYPTLAKQKGTTALQLSGIQILGNSDITISNVLVRNAVSKKLDHRGRQFECFQVYVYNKWSTNLPGSYFLDRIAIAEYQGGYTSAICVNGHASGSIRNCTVDLAPDGTQQYGLNFAAGIEHFTIANNRVSNVSRGINNDTGPVCKDVRIVGNRLLQCATGMLLANSVSNVIAANSIELNGTGTGIAIRCHPTMEHVKSSACTVISNSLSGPGGEGISLCYANEFTPLDTSLYWSTNNIVQNNVLSPALENKIPPASVAQNLVRPGNRRHVENYAACNRANQLVNLAAVGFPSDIGIGAACAYPEARAVDTGYGYIARVKLSGTALDMKSDWGNGSGYTDFTTGYPLGEGRNKLRRTYYVQSADVHRGQRYKMTIDAGGFKYPMPASFRVYIDWNHNGSFEEPDDLVLSEASRSSVNRNLTIPEGAPVGSTRMRVILACGRIPGPADSKTFWGEVEDYTLNVVP